MLFAIVSFLLHPVAFVSGWYRSHAAFDKEGYLRCRIDEECQGYFIGRRHCSVHNVVWDDGGRCPREKQEVQPFAFARDLPGGRW